MEGDGGTARADSNSSLRIVVGCSLRLQVVTTAAGSIQIAATDIEEEAAAFLLEGDDLCGLAWCERAVVVDCHVACCRAVIGVLRGAEDIRCLVTDVGNQYLVAGSQRRGIGHQFIAWGVVVRIDGGFVRIDRLDIVVIAEGFVHTDTPDVFLQTGIVDEGVAVFLNVVDSVVAGCFFLADGVVLRPLHQHLQLPFLQTGIGIAVDDIYDVGGTIVGIPVGEFFFVAGHHIEICTREVTLIFVVRFEDGTAVSVVGAGTELTEAVGRNIGRIVDLAEGVVGAFAVDESVGRIDMVQVGIHRCIAAEPALWPRVLAVVAVAFLVVGRAAGDRRVAGSIGIHIPNLPVAVHISSLEGFPEVVIRFLRAVIDDAAQGCLQGCAHLAVGWLIVVGLGVWCRFFAAVCVANQFDFIHIGPLAACCQGDGHGARCIREADGAERPAGGGCELRDIGGSSRDGHVQLAGVAAIFLQIEGQRAVARHRDVASGHRAGGIAGTELQAATVRLCIVGAAGIDLRQRSPSVIVKVCVGHDKCGRSVAIACIATQALIEQSGCFGCRFFTAAGTYEVERDGAVAVLRDILHRNVEIFRAVAVVVEERGGRRGALAEGVDRAVGERVVLGSLLSVILVALIGSVLIFVVGRDPCHALMTGVVVGLVACPYGGVIVDMQDEESLSGQSFVPSCLLTVLQQVVFVAVALIINNVCIAAHGLQGLHVADGLGGFQFDGLFPSCHPALIAGVACRLVAVAVVGAVVHQVPAEHTLTAAVVGVVEVGVAQTVAELMAHGADAGNGS